MYPSAPPRAVGYQTPVCVPWLPLCRCIRGQPLSIPHLCAQVALLLYRGLSPNQTPIAAPYWHSCCHTVEVAGNLETLFGSL